MCADHHVLARIADRLSEAWNDGDAPAWAAQFTDDAVFIDVLGRVQRGREVIAEQHAKIFTTIYAGSTLEVEVLDVRSLDAGLLLAHTTTRLDVPDGPRAGTTHAVQTKLVASDRVAAFHNTVVSDPAAFADDRARLRAV